MKPIQTVIPMVLMMMMMILTKLILLILWWWRIVILLIILFIQFIDYYSFVIDWLLFWNTNDIILMILKTIDLFSGNEILLKPLLMTMTTCYDWRWLIDVEGDMTDDWRQPVTDDILMMMTLMMTVSWRMMTATNVW